MSYAKLFSSITESSLWSEPKEVRLLFVSMLARADSTGFVEASVPGLARMANLTREEVEASLATLEGPDKDSKDQTDGRRILKVSGGWVLVNYEAYRNRSSDEDRREYMREYMREYRRKHGVNNVNSPLATLGQTEGETIGETEGKTEVSPVVGNPNGSPRRRRSPIELPDEDWAAIRAMLQAVAKRVPPRPSPKDTERRTWIKNAILAQTTFTEGWLIDAAEATVNAKAIKTTRQKYFQGVLKQKAQELGFSNVQLTQMRQAIEIPSHIWDSDILRTP